MTEIQLAQTGPSVPSGARKDPGALAKPWSALANLGSTVGGIGLRVLEAQRQSALNQARMVYRKQTLDYMEKASTEPDHAVIRAGWDELVGRLLNEIPKQFAGGDENLKENFANELNGMAIEDGHKVRMLAFRKEAETANAALMGALDGEARAAHLAPTEAAVDAYKARMIEMIDGNVASGWSTPEQGMAEKLRRFASLDEGRVLEAINRDPFIAEKLLTEVKDGAYTQFKHLQPDDRERQIDRARSEQKGLAAEQARRIGEIRPLIHDLQQNDMENIANFGTGIKHEGQDVSVFFKKVMKPVEYEVWAKGRKYMQDGYGILQQMKALPPSQWGALRDTLTPQEGDPDAFQKNQVLDRVDKIGTAWLKQLQEDPAGFVESVSPSPPGMSAADAPPGVLYQRRMVQQQSRGIENPRPLTEAEAEGEVRNFEKNNSEQRQGRVLQWMGMVGGGKPSMFGAYKKEAIGQLLAAGLKYDALATTYASAEGAKLLATNYDTPTADLKKNVDDATGVEKEAMRQFETLNRALPPNVPAQTSGLRETLTRLALIYKGLGNSDPVKAAYTALIGQNYDIISGKDHDMLVPKAYRANNADIGDYAEWKKDNPETLGAYKGQAAFPDAGFHAQIRDTGEWIANENLDGANLYYRPDASGSMIPVVTPDGKPIGFKYAEAATWKEAMRKKERQTPIPAFAEVTP